MQIADKELRDLFKIESDEQLQRLESGLLELENDPGNHGLLDEAFRQIHSLKGGARMLLLPDMEAIAHRLESVLGAAKKGELRLTPEIIDRLYRALDALRKLAHEAVTGERAEVAVEEILAQLLQKEASAEAKEVVAAGVPAGRTGAGVGPFRIETIRVSTGKLDALMPLLGELGVTKNRLVHRLTAIDEIIAAWDSLKRVGGGLQSALNEIGSSAGNGSAKRLMEHHAREKQLMEDVGKLLNSVRAMAHEDSAKLESIAGDLEDSIRSIRLLPLSTIFIRFPRMVRDLARSQGKEAHLVIEGASTTADKRVLEEIKDPLMHMTRNAIDHGIELPDERERAGKPPCGLIELRAYQTAANVVIELKDDGRGLDIEAIKSTALRTKVVAAAEIEAMSPAEIQALIFVSGLSTSTFVSDLSGRGVGLDVARDNVERLKGSVHIESDPGRGCTFRVQVPVTMATARVLIVEVAGRKYAIPVEHVESLRLVSPREIVPVQGQETVVVNSLPVSVVRLADLLEVREFRRPEGIREALPAMKAQAVSCIVIAAGSERVGLLVDELVDEQEIVLKPQSKILKRVRNVAGATILGTGEICTVLDAPALLKSVRKWRPPSAAGPEEEEAQRTRVILMAEDSLTTRTQMKRILEGGGYEVVAAVDGLDAFNKIASRPFDALVTDVMMPNMDGLTLTQKLRENPKYKELPIILVTTLASDEDRKRGLQVGASAYITKPAFDQKVLLDTLRRLT